jgi:DNA helicase-2/ATP-dependent DNA helicase PcrA
MKEFSEKTNPDDPYKVNTLGDFLIDVALLTDVDNEDENDRNRVSMMTIHAAKGLEFGYVNIVGLEENLFPSQLSINSREDLEEERRLFYVALTRAEKKATLSYALTRYRWGQLSYCEPSRFIEELDERFLELPQQEQRPVASRPVDFHSERLGFRSNSRPQQDRPQQERNLFGEEPPIQQAAPPAGNFKKLSTIKTPTAAPAASSGDWTPAEEIAVGHEVFHEKFGKGKVLVIEGNAPDIKATVFFPSAGQKQLLLKFAKLRVVG